MNLTRRQILQGGRYAACPKQTLATKDITAADKVTYTTMIGFLFSDDADRIFPSTATLARAAGLGRRTIIRSIARLQDVGLIATVHRPGRPTTYTFPTADGMDPSAPSAPDLSQNGTPPASNGHTPPAVQDGQQPHGGPERHTPPGPQAAPELHDTPADLPTTPADLAGAYKEDERLRERSDEPPKPPGGESHRQPQNGPGNRPADPTIAIVDRLRHEYRQATGRQMPARWARDAGNEYRDGDRATLLQIDADTIRKGMTYAKRRGLAFAFQTLILAVHQTPKPDGAITRQNEQRAAATAQTMADAEAAHRTAQAARQQAALEYFTGLEKTEQARWTEQAASLPGVDRAGPDALEALAALRAYNAKPTGNGPEHKEKP